MRTHLPKFRLNRKALFGMMVLAAVGASPVYAATITVDPTAADAAVAGDAKCSLREAVLSVNAGANVGDCVAVVTEAYGTNDTIVLPAGTYTLTLSGVDEIENAATTPLDVLNTPDATIGDLDVTKSVRIIGAGSLLTTIQWDPAIAAASRDRIFHVNAATGTVNVVIQGVKLTQGQTTQVDLGAGPASGSGPLPTNYYLRRAGGALAVGPAANVVLVDPNITGQANSQGRGGSKRPTDPDEGGATFNLTLTDVIVDGNNAQGDGGGIYTAAAMTATSTIVRNNTAATNGGGVYNEGNTTIVASTISGNTAEGGGGVFLTGSNTVNIAGATLTANRAVGGGAISGRAGVTINVVNSTLSGNIGSDVGAGFYSNGKAQLNFVTIAKNLAGADSPDAGSGINLFPASSTTNSVTLKNVLLADNKKGWLDGMDAAAIAALLSANCGVTGGGLTVTSSGGNLSSDASCNAWLTAATDKKSVDPKISALADNGGPTQTHALAADSPALSAGAADAAVTVDQRGQPRESPPDIGAFELANVSATEPVVGGGGGGCTVGGEKPFDPALPAMLAAALAVLGLRRRAVK
jgi:hypothetical protein